MSNKFYDYNEPIVIHSFVQVMDDTVIKISLSDEEKEMLLNDIESLNKD